MIEAIANSGGKLPERQVAIKVALPLLTALRQLHSTGIVHRDIKPEHLMIHNGTLRLGDFGSAGCASCSAAALASTLQKQALGPGSKRRWHQSEHQQIDQQQLLEELEALEQQRQQQQHRHQQHHQQQHESHQQLHLQADCTAEATINCCQQPHSCDHLAARFGVNTDAVSGRLSPSLSARVSVQAVRDAMNFRIGSIEYMAPEMLNKPTAAEVFHLVSCCAAADLNVVARQQRCTGSLLLLYAYISSGCCCRRTCCHACASFACAPSWSAPLQRLC